MAAYRVEGSIDIHPDDLALFQVPPTESAYDRIQWIEHRPVASIKERNPIEFIISGSGTQYIDLKETLLRIRVKVTNSTKDSATVAGLVNLPLHTLWDQVEVSLQQKIINPSSQHYGYKALIETLMSFGSDAKSSLLQSAGFYKDIASHIDKPNPVSGGNTGLTQRYNLTKSGKVAEFIGPLHADVCQQDRLILNGVEVQVKLYPNKQAFCLISEAEDTEEFKLEITDASLYVCKVSVAPPVLIAHTQLLASDNQARYPYHRTEIKQYTVSKGSFYWKAENLFQGAIPTSLVIFFVKTSSFVGTFKENPFVFVHQKLNSLALYLDNIPYPSKPLRPDFDKNTFTECYFNLFAGQASQDTGNAISLADFASGYSLFAFELQPSLAKDHFPLIKRGSLNVEASFAEALTENTNAFVMARFPDMFTIDASRNVIM